MLSPGACCLPGQIVSGAHCLPGHIVFRGTLSPGAYFLPGHIVSGAGCLRGGLSPGHIISGAYCLPGQIVSGADYLGADCLGAHCLGAYCLGADCLGAPCPSTTNSKITNRSEQTNIKEDPIQEYYKLDFVRQSSLCNLCKIAQDTIEDYETTKGIRLLTTIAENMAKCVLEYYQTVEAYNLSFLQPGDSTEITEKIRAVSYTHLTLPTIPQV